MSFLGPLIAEQRTQEELLKAKPVIEGQEPEFSDEEEDIDLGGHSNESNQEDANAADADSESDDSDDNLNINQLKAKQQQKEAHKERMHQVRRAVKKGRGRKK